MRCRAALLLIVVMLAVMPAAGRTPEADPELRRELRIGGDVLRAALTDMLPEPRRVVAVDAGYLAGQGVLVVVDLASSWLHPQITRPEMDPHITRLEQIPDMVHDILEDLNLGLSRHQRQDLHELREIRDAQRAVRAEQRALRGELRARRRALLDAGNERAAQLQREIDTLNASLAAAEAEERSLVEDAGAVRHTLESPDPDAAVGSMPADMDLAVAESVCGYGATFSSLAADEHLNVLIRQGDVSHYYVFPMAMVRACQAGGLSPEALLEKGHSYRSWS